MTSALLRPTLHGMARRFAHAPTAEEFAAIARATLARLPTALATQMGDIVLEVQDYAEDAMLDEMGLTDPFALTGVYEGIPLTERSLTDSGMLPDRVRLFRLPILLEWCERGDESLDHLIAHVTIHEIGHHFGLSDEAMHALEEQVL